MRVGMDILKFIWNWGMVVQSFKCNGLQTSEVVWVRGLAGLHWVNVLYSSTTNTSLSEYFSTGAGELNAGV